MKPERDTPERDELVDSLAQLPKVDLDPGRAAHIRSLARALLEADQPRSWLARVERVYSRVLEPALVIGVSGIYLAWAFRTASELLALSPLR